MAVGRLLTWPELINFLFIFILYTASWETMDGGSNACAPATFLGDSEQVLSPKSLALASLPNTTLSLFLPLSHLLS